MFTYQIFKNSEGKYITIPSFEGKRPKGYEGVDPSYFASGDTEVFLYGKLEDVGDLLEELVEKHPSFAAAGPNGWHFVDSKPY
jgi:hypothetical protein